MFVTSSKVSGDGAALVQTFQKSFRNTPWKHRSKVFGVSRTFLQKGSWRDRRAEPSSPPQRQSPAKQIVCFNGMSRAPSPTAFMRNACHFSKVFGVQRTACARTFFYKKVLGRFEPEPRPKPKRKKSLKHRIDGRQAFRRSRI